MKYSLKNVHMQANQNNFLQMVLLEELKRVLGRQKIDVKTSLQNKISVLTITFESTKNSSGSIEIAINESFSSLKPVLRDLHLFLYQASVLRQLDFELYEHWIKILMWRNAYFNTLFYLLSKTLPLLKNKNSSFEVIESLLSINYNFGLIKQLQVDIENLDLNISLSNDLYETVTLEYGDNLFESLRLPWSIFDTYKIPIHFKKNNDKHDAIEICAKTFMLCRFRVDLHDLPAMSIYNDKTDDASFSVQWFSKENYSTQQLIKEGYIVLDYTTLIQYVLKSMFNALVQCKREMNAAEVYALNKFFITNPFDRNFEDHVSKYVTTDITPEPKEATSVKALPPSIEKNNQTFTPSSIIRELDTSIAGQDKAKSRLANILYWHQRASLDASIEHIETSLLIAGPTGSGKTFMMQQSAKLLDLPFIHVDASQLVPEGYRGFSISNVIKNILRESSYDLARAESSIVFFDECDKLNSKDEYDRAVINQLLRFRGDSSFPINKDFYEDFNEFENATHLNTNGMLKVFAGSFYYQTQDQTSSMGFLSSQSNQISDDLISKAFPPEFRGRINEMIIFEPLDQDNIYDFLRNRSSVFTRYRNNIEHLGHKVYIEDDVYKAIAAEVAISPYGMRSIEHIASKLFNPLRLKAPELSASSFCITTEDLHRCDLKQRTK